MKKILSILMLFFLILNTFGIIAYYYYNGSVIKSEIKALMKSNIPKDKIEYIAVPKNSRYYTRIHSKEFRYYGKMYDIISESIEGDSIYFKCINDEKEEQLMKSISQLYFGTEDGLVSHRYAGNFLKISFIPIFEQKIFSNYIIEFSNLNYCVVQENCLTGFTTVALPPPKS